MLLKWFIKVATCDLCPPAPDQPQELLVAAAPAPTLYDWASRSTHLHRFVHKYVHQSVLGALIALGGGGCGFRRVAERPQIGYWALVT